METEFIARRGSYNIYRFTCDHCGVYGEVGIPADSQRVFDHGCGSGVLLIQRLPTAMFGKPYLEPIQVQPGGVA